MPEVGDLIVEEVAFALWEASDGQLKGAQFRRPIWDGTYSSHALHLRDEDYEHRASEDDYGTSTIHGRDHFRAQARVAIATLERLHCLSRTD